MDFSGFALKYWLRHLESQKKRQKLLSAFRPEAGTVAIQIQESFRQWFPAAPVFWKRRAFSCAQFPDCPSRSSGWLSGRREKAKMIFLVSILKIKVYTLYMGIICWDRKRKIEKQKRVHSENSGRTDAKHVWTAFKISRQTAWCETKQAAGQQCTDFFSQRLLTYPFTFPFFIEIIPIPWVWFQAKQFVYKCRIIVPPLHVWAEDAASGVL